MAKSRTRKKFNKKSAPAVPAEIAQVTNLATEYIKKWTRTELGRLQQSQNTSVCIPTSDGYKIGLYNLKILENKTCEVYDHNNELVHRFDNKVNAVLYTIYTIKKRFWIADEILRLDKEINNSYVDVVTLRRSVELSRQVKDYFKVDIKLARLEIAEKRLELAREHISKIHKTAKYNKVWE